MGKFLWNFGVECGRSGDLDGMFVATEEEIDNIIGKQVYFYEVLGKHSEIQFNLKKDHITKVDLDSTTVEKVTKVLGNTWGGINPFGYVQYTCPKCENTYESYEFNVDKGICGYCEDE